MLKGLRRKTKNKKIEKIGKKKSKIRKSKIRKTSKDRYGYDQIILNKNSKVKSIDLNKVQNKKMLKFEEMFDEVI